MQMIEIERIAARKFVEIKGVDYLDTNKYIMSKNVTYMEETNEIKFDFLIAKAGPKEAHNIVVDESIPWDEIISISVNKETGSCQVS